MTPELRLKVYGLGVWESCCYQTGEVFPAHDLLQNFITRGPQLASERCEQTLVALLALGRIEPYELCSSPSQRAFQSLMYGKKPPGGVLPGTYLHWSYKAL